MPSKSAKQHRLMMAAAHNAAFAKKVGMKQSVARDYVSHDKSMGLYQKSMAKKGRKTGRK